MKKKLFWMMGIIVIAPIIVVGISYLGSNTSQFKGPVTTDEPLPDALIADLEKYVARVMRQNDVPGVAMVLVLEENQYIFYESTFVGKTIQLNMDPDGTPPMRWPGEYGTYNFVAGPTIQE